MQLRAIPPEDVSSVSDIDTGQLAAVLQLLYALSTFKQQVRQKKKEERLEKAASAVVVSNPPASNTATMPPSTATKYVTFCSIVY